VRSTLARNRVSIVLYHDPDPSTLDAQLAYLARRYSLISLERLVNAIHLADWSDVPPRSVVVTLDDGHTGNFRLLESFRRHRARPTIYLCTRAVVADGALTSDPEAPKATQRALSRDEIAAMRDDCDFGSHTRSHPILTACASEQAEREIADSKTEVEALTGRSCVHFAYPAGAYSDRTVELVREAGYRSAHTVDNGWNQLGSDPYRLKVGSIDPQTPTRLAADLAGMSWLTRLLVRKTDLRGRRVFRAASGD
jgi:peptidoglycan/xylan/chitin deacetylase (PgdA/CDA1 family)